MSLTDAFDTKGPGPAKAHPSNDVVKATPRLRKYAEATLATLCAELAATPEGTRNSTLNGSAMRAGHMVCSGWIGESTVRNDLLAAAKRCGLGDSEAQKTFESGFGAGTKTPAKEPEDSPEYERRRSDNVKDDYREQQRREAQEQPTAREPLRGLKHLGKVAVVGRSNFVALASEPVNYVWQDLVVAATICLIAGPPAEGKTTLLFLLVAGRLNHEPVNLLGHELQPAPEGQYVVLIEGEHGESSAARKLVKSFQLLGLDNSGLDRLILVARKAVRLASPEWRDIEKLIGAGLVSDIAIDTIARVAPANPDSEVEQVEIFDTVAQAIDKAPEDLKPTAWAIAHTRKNGTGGLADVSGSAQRTGQADTVLMLKADKASGKVASVEVTFEKLRESPDEYPDPATFTIAKNADGSPRLEQAMAPGADDDRPLEPRILDLLAIEPRTQSALMKLLKRSWKDIDAALTVLFSERQIQTTTVQVRGQDRKAFALRPRGSYPT